MCGRFGLDVTWAELCGNFNLISPHDKNLEFAPRYNIAPTQPIIMVDNSLDGTQSFQHVRWGFLPSWVKDPKEFTLIINARSETAIEKPSFRNAMRHRRTLVPVSGFYEWQRFGNGQKSQPYWVRPREGGLMALGGLMETWSDPNGSEIDTGCILSTTTNKSFSEIHHRLPVVIHPSDFEQWLDCGTQEPREVENLMKPVDDDYFECIPVGDLVNKVANTGKDIQTRVEKTVPKKPPEKPTDDQMSLF